jgi:hypothetical protein
MQGRKQNPAPWRKLASRHNKSFEHAYGLKLQSCQAGEIEVTYVEVLRP